MKKIFALAMIPALLSVSCTKDYSAGQDALPAGKIVSFTVGVPGPEDEVTKIALGELSGNKIPVSWTSGDSFRLFTCHEQNWYFDHHEAEDLVVSDCGNFTTAGSGSSSVFTGVIPEGAIIGENGLEGIAFFPSSLYTEGSATVSKPSDVTAQEKYNILVKTTIPEVQTGAGVPYLCATSRLIGGNMSKFVFGTALVKINLPSGTGIDRIKLSKVASDKPLGGSDVKLYYYFKESVSQNLSITSGEQYYSLTVDNDGAELEGDVYFAVRNLDSGTKLTFDFCDRNGGKAFKSMSGTLSTSLSLGTMLDFGTVNPTEVPVTAVSYLADTKDNFATGVAGEYFPWPASKDNGVYPISISEPHSEIDYTWYNTEHTYSYNGYEWTFGSNTVFAAERPANNDGMYYYNGSSRKELRMDKGSYLKIPMVSGKKFFAVKCSVKNGSNTTALVSATKDGVSPMAKLTLKHDDGEVFFDVVGAVADTQYYLKSSGAFQPSSLVFLYR